jgi:AcrR family transcriptional regulator
VGPRPRLQPRKDPVQQRAHDTRARILDAAARIFAEHGYAAGTTNRIAAAADLSIGSLYQYFPNKDAILVELVRAHIADSTTQLSALLDAGLPDGIEHRLRAAVELTIALHAHDHRLHQVLFEEAPWPPDVLDDLRAREEEIVSVVAALLADDPQVTVADPVLAARLAVATIESLVHRLIAHDPPVVDPATLADELVALLVGYLTAPAPSAAAATGRPTRPAVRR